MKKVLILSLTSIISLSCFAGFLTGAFYNITGKCEETNLDGHVIAHLNMNSSKEKTEVYIEPHFESRKGYDSNDIYKLIFLIKENNEFYKKNNEFTSTNQCILYLKKRGTSFRYNKYSSINDDVYATEQYIFFYQKKNGEAYLSVSIVQSKKKQSKTIMIGQGDVGSNMDIIWEIPYTTRNYKAIYDVIEECYYEGWFEQLSK